jgi:putative polyhydroxyalkanoate system protein
MSRIAILRPHGTTLKKAKAAVDALAADLAAEFDLDLEWEGNTLHFTRAGVEGTIVVGAKTLDIQATLGMLVSMLKSRIEREVHQACDEHFGPVA